MGRKSVLAAAGLALLGVVWILGRQLFESGDPPAQAAAPEQPPPGAEGPLEPSAQPGEIRAVDLEEPGAPRANSARRGERAPPPPVEDASARELQVRTKEDGQPVPGAQVRFTTLADDADVWDHPAWSLATCDAWLAEHGESAQCDSSGHARLGLSPSVGFLAVGSAPDLWGRLHVEAGEEGELVLELLRDATIHAVTVDGRGAALDGVPVALRKRGTWGQSDTLVVRSADGGRAVLPHIGLTLADDRESRWSVGVAAALAQPVEIAIDRDHLPAETLVLTVPATGSLEIVVHGMAGGPQPGMGRVELCLHDPSRGSAPSFWARPDTLESALVEGRALFSHVGLGLEFDVEARGHGSTVPTRVAGPGPRAPGERALLEVTLGSDHPVLRMRILDASGGPAANATLKARFELRSELNSDQFEYDLVTDEAAVAWYDISSMWSKGSRRTLDLRRESNAQGPGGQSGSSARIDLSREFQPGPNDLGDVRLRAANRIASGRVESHDGTPVEGAEVIAVLSREPGASEEPYVGDNRLETHSDAQGRFEILGSAEAATLRLSASRGDPRSETLECRVGASGLVLTLREGGRIAGRLLLDAAVPADALSVGLGPSSEATERLAVGTEPSPDGDFELRSVPAGTYDLIVNSKRGGPELARIAGLLVLDGGSCADPRLGAIDLRGTLIAFTLELVPPRPDDRLAGVVTALLIGPPSGDQERLTTFLHGSRIPFVLRARAVDLDVHVQDFRAVHLSDVRRDTRVELEPGLRVRLRLSGDDPLPSPPRYLKPFLSAEEQPPGSMGHLQTSVVDADREIVLSAESAGTLYVHWLLEVRSENSLMTTTMRADPPQKIEVRDVPGEQVFEIAFPKAALEARRKQDDD